MLVECFLCEENSRYLCITWNKKLYRQVDAAFFQKQLDLPKNFSTKKQLDCWFDALQVKLAKNYAVRLLSIRNYPSEIIKQKLLEKKISEKIVQLVVKDLIRRGYINDKDWLEHFILQEIRKGNGPKMIFFKLQKKKIAFSEIKEYMNKMLPESKEKEKILEYLRKNMHKPKEKKIAALLRKGFNHASIFEVLDLY